MSTSRELTDRIVARSRRGQPPVAAEEVAAFAREAAALGDASLATKLWGTHKMALDLGRAVDGAFLDAYASTYEWGEPINDPEWNR